MSRGIRDAQAINRSKISKHKGAAEEWLGDLPRSSQSLVPHDSIGDNSRDHTHGHGRNCLHDAYLVHLARGLRELPTGGNATELTDAIAHALVHGHYRVMLSGF